MDVVYAMTSGHVGGPDDLMVMVMKGTHWPASDPVVLRSPTMFSTDPRWGLRSSVPPPDEPPAEAEPVVQTRRSARAAS
jgi:hypothetical protein